MDGLDCPLSSKFFLVLPPAIQLVRAVRLVEQAPLGVSLDPLILEHACVYPRVFAFNTQHWFGFDRFDNLN